MKLNRATLTLARLAAAMAVAAFAATTTGSAPDAQVTPVIAEHLPNVPGKRSRPGLVTYPPGGKAGGSSSCGSVFSHVLSGHIRSEARRSVREVYGAGEGFFEAPGTKHLISENASADEPASLLAVFVADDGAQLTQPNE
jgi:quercetin dioxygenase-like cupin family protein